MVGSTILLQFLLMLVAGWLQQSSPLYRYSLVAYGSVNRDVHLVSAFH
jgi:hypothetical protein